MTGVNADYSKYRERRVVSTGEGFKCYKRRKGEFFLVGEVTTEEEKEKFLRGRPVRFRLFRRD